jgi:peptidoglycan hydrolase-like protein with peptidoglycan-binding domain
MKHTNIAIASIFSLLFGAFAFAQDEGATDENAAQQEDAAAQQGTAEEGATQPQQGADQDAAATSESEQMGEAEGAAAGSNDDPTVIRKVQEKLNSMGYNAGAVDGAYGPKTQAALKKFQQSQGIQVSGELNQETLAALGVEGSSVTGAAGEGAEGEAGTEAGAAEEGSSQDPADADAAEEPAESEESSQ